MIRAYLVYEIHCDGCEEVVADETGAPFTFDDQLAASSAAFSVGWVCTPSDERSYCRDCAPQALIDEEDAEDEEAERDLNVDEDDPEGGDCGESA